MKEIKDRLFVHPTPSFFKNARKYSLYLGGVCAALSGVVIASYPSSRFGTVLATIAGILTTVVPVMLSLPVDDNTKIN